MTKTQAAETAPTGDQVLKVVRNIPQEQSEENKGSGAGRRGKADSEPDSASPTKRPKRPASYAQVEPVARADGQGQVRGRARNASRPQPKPAAEAKAATPVRLDPTAWATRDVKAVADLAAARFRAAQPSVPAVTSSATRAEAEREVPWHNAQRTKHGLASVGLSVNEDEDPKRARGSDRGLLRLLPTKVAH